MAALGAVAAVVDPLGDLLDILAAGKTIGGLWWSLAGQLERVPFVQTALGVILGGVINAYFARQGERDLKREARQLAVRRPKSSAW